MSLNVQTNVAMPRNQMAFKSNSDKQIICIMKKYEQRRCEGIDLGKILEIMKKNMKELIWVKL